MIELPFVGPSYTLKTVSVDAQSSVNLYPDLVESKNGKSTFVLRRTPGLNLKGTLNGTYATRELYQTSTSRLFGVCGNTLNEVLADNTVINHGTINSGLNPSGSTPVRMANNETQLIIVDGTNGWIFTLATNTLAIITDSDFPQMATHVDYLDGYFIVNQPDTGKFFWSDLGDGTTWNSLNFATAEGSPDNLEALIVAGRRIWLMGAQSYECFYNTGDSSATFLRFEGSFNNIGIAAKYSLAKMDKILFWLGSNDQGYGQVWRTEGFEPLKVSSSAIDEAIQSYATIEDAIGFCYQQDGNKFYQISFPLADKTWVYDLMTGLWHERSYRDSLSGLPKAHRANCQAFFNGKVYVGDRENGKLYIYDLDKYTDNGDTILCKRVTPHYWNALDRLFFGTFQIDMEVGVGISTGQGSDPKIMLENSNDGGHTFGTGIEKSIGAMGKYQTRVRWTRQGSARDRVVRVTVSDPVPLTFLNAHVTMRGEG